MTTDRDTLAATKLTRTEFAVVRAYAQGMRPIDIANRYLRDPDDDDDLTEHQAVLRILALRDRLVQFALQHDRPDIADMFEALRGRSDAGMTRRVEALSSIEQLGQGRPLPSHQVSLWFGPSLARRLVAAEIRTISDLIGLANQRGSSWWRHVPRIGRQSAETIVRWLRHQQMSTAVREFVVEPSQIAAQSALLPGPLAASMTAPLPLESMEPPIGDGLWEAELADDLRFVWQWLGAKSGSANTWKSYRREVERILLWAATRQRSLRSLTPDDLRAYDEFLANPEPALFWCGPSGPRDKVHWRPFEGPLRRTSRETALRIVRMLVREIRADGPAPRRRNAKRERDGASSNAGTQMDAGQSNAGVAPRPEGVPDAASDTASIRRFIEWLGSTVTSPRHRAARAAALLISKHGLHLVDLPSLCLKHLEICDVTRQLSIASSRSGNVEQLGDEVCDALVAHWADRGVVWDREEADWNEETALLAPLHFPGTGRGAAKRLRPSAGYSASGLDQLLRACWKQFATGHPDVLTAFTPGMLRRAA